MTQLKKMIIWLLCAIIVANVFSFWRNAYGIRVYSFQSVNADFTYMCIPAKGRRMEDMKRAVRVFEDDTNTNVILCRDFGMNYFKFWNWYDYMTNPYYNFPKCPVMERVPSLQSWR